MGRYRSRHVANDQGGATSLEWALLLAAVAIPAYWLIQLGLDLLTNHYRMMTTLNGLPLP